MADELVERLTEQGNRAANWFRHDDAATCDEAATTITRLTEANAAQAREIGALRDAAREVLHCWHSDTGFVESVRSTTGKPWPWYHGEKGLAALRALTGGPHGETR